MQVALTGIYPYARQAGEDTGNFEIDLMAATGCGFQARCAQCKSEPGTVQHWAGCSGITFCLL